MRYHGEQDKKRNDKGVDKMKKNKFGVRYISLFDYSQHLGMPEEEFYLEYIKFERTMEKIQDQDIRLDAVLSSLEARLDGYLMKEAEKCHYV